MTGLFFILGLITFFKGRLLCRRPLRLLQYDMQYVEGKAVKTIGLMMCVIDVIPLLGYLLMPLMDLNPIFIFILIPVSAVINMLLSSVPCFFLERHDY